MAMRLARAAGFESFEICVGLNGPVRLDASEKDTVRLRTHADSIGIRLESVACAEGWMSPLSSPDEAVRARGMEATAQSLRLASWLGAESVLVVPGVVNAETAYDAALTNAREAIGHLVADAESRRVALCLENVWNKFLLSPVEMAAFIDGFGSHQVAAYFDTGNILLYGYPEQWITILGQRIRKVHAKDFRAGVGTLDGFVMLLEGDVHWPAVMKALAAIGYDGPLTAEYASYTHSLDATMRHIRQSLEEIIGLANPA